MSDLNTDKAGKRGQVVPIVPTVPNELLQSTAIVQLLWEAIDKHRADDSAAAQAFGDLITSLPSSALISLGASALKAMCVAVTNQNVCDAAHKCSVNLDLLDKASQTYTSDTHSFSHTHTHTYTQHTAL